MDINSLLSPAESPATETPPPFASPSPRSSPVKRPGRPSVQQRKSSGLSQQLTLSPQEQSLPSIAAHNAAVAYQNQQGVYGQPVTSPTFQTPSYSTASTSPLHLTPLGDSQGSTSQLAMHRQGSTPQMDTLADLASMQQHQHPARQNSTGMRDPQNMSYNMPNLSRPPLSAHASNEVLLADAPAKEPRVYMAHALSDTDCKALTELGQHLLENSFDFPSHTSFVNLLHKGFRNHVDTGSDPHEYELLADLRQARQAMDRIFPLGEKMWAHWLQDEMLLAKSIDDRVKIMEYFTIAVTDEPSSASLWRMYGDYMYYLWSTTYEVNGTDSDGWSAEDKEVAKEVFKWEPMMATWERGVASTQRRLNDSNVVWDRYMEILIQDHQKWPSSQKIQNIKDKFAERLTFAHATWEQTRQMLSNFLSTYDDTSYEATMVAVSRRGPGVQGAYAIRERYEASIEKAVQNGDEAAEWTAYTDYLAWEVKKKGVFSFDLINGLYERATIRYQSTPSLWIEYIEFLIENASRDFAVLTVIERATRHCPWSGDLWLHRLLTMEAEGKEFGELENTKHHATSTGLLDVGGMEELMKVYVAWCGCLRRRAFAVEATEDDLDIADVAISGALEHVKQIGQNKYGKDFSGDPQYRLERIHIKFLTQRGLVSEARNIWESLVAAQANSYDFWYRYYIWEMVMWAKFAMRATDEPEAQLRTPDQSTKVLEQGLAHVETMDWPEQLIQMYVNHCEQHETVQHLRTAIIAVRRFTTIVTKRREKEAADAAVAYQNQENTEPTVVDAQMNGKRKRSEDAAADENVSKKAKADLPLETASSSAQSQAKRDREHTTIIVDNLPLDADELKIRRFFRDCGTINSINLVSEESYQVATIEFERQEDAIFAQTKSAKPFEDRELKITFGTGTTLWVTNYPPEADKEYIRDIFKDCGEIVDIRFPSLVANTRRRFCYVQFLNPDMAQKGAELNGTNLGDPFKLVARISDPVQKGARSGATEEGRECYVQNVYWHATERDVKTLFDSYGKVDNVRLPKNIAGKGKGIAYVVFSDKASAERAASRLNQTEFRGRTITVEVSKPKGSRTITTVHRRAGSATPDAASPSATSVDMNGHAENTNAHNSRARTIAIMNIPDTVTAARVEKLVEPYGELVKFTLRPDHAGAIVEFAEKKSVALAEIGLANYELEGQKIQLGTVPELLQQKPMLRTSKLADKLAEKKKEDQKKKNDNAATASPFGGLAPRQTQGARGTGRRGGLGFKSRGAFGAGSNTRPNDDGNKATGGKSNDYFKNLMAGGKNEKTGVKNVNTDKPADNDVNMEP